VQCDLYYRHTSSPCTKTCTASECTGLNDLSTLAAACSCHCSPSQVTHHPHQGVPGLCFDGAISFLWNPHMMM
jgi:hypothetical protein